MLLNHVDYSSFGQVLAQTNATAGDRFLFTGRELDAVTQQYNFRARYYNASTGKFTQQDPIGFDALDANLFRYSNNSPTNGTDPTGTASVLEYTYAAAVFGVLLTINDCLGAIPLPGVAPCKIALDILRAFEDIAEQLEEGLG